ncbi:MAG: hypothetical protein ACLSHC_17290 [Bilophila wadsworthia]
MREKKNVIVVMLDTLQFNYLGFMAIRGQDPEHRPLRHRRRGLRKRLYGRPAPALPPGHAHRALPCR